MPHSGLWPPQEPGISRGGSRAGRDCLLKLLKIITTARCDGRSCNALPYCIVLLPLAWLLGAPQARAQENFSLAASGISDTAAPLTLPGHRDQRNT